MSYVVISAARVRAACEAFLAERDTRIHLKREEMIEATIANSLKTLSSRLFGHGPMSREDAVTDLKSRVPHNAFPRWDEPALLGALQADAVRDLRALAISSEDGFVHLSAKHASWLASFLREV